ncbi:MAG: hypothetical protein R2798_12335 [Chitinophagales bacterium]|nr:hypothetical protein [Chitinophagales bacterium]
MKNKPNPYKIILTTALCWLMWCNYLQAQTTLADLQEPIPQNALMADSILTELTILQAKTNTYIAAMDSLFAQDDSLLLGIEFRKFTEFAWALQQAKAYDVVLKYFPIYKHHYFMNASDVLRGYVLYIQKLSLKPENAIYIKNFTNYIFYSNYLDKTRSEIELDYVQGLLLSGGNYYRFFPNKFEGEKRKNVAYIFKNYNVFDE